MWGKEWVYLAVELNYFEQKDQYTLNPLRVWNDSSKHSKIKSEVLVSYNLYYFHPF